MVEQSNILLHAFNHKTQTLWHKQQLIARQKGHYKIEASLVVLSCEYDNRLVVSSSSLQLEICSSYNAWGNIKQRSGKDVCFPGNLPDCRLLSSVIAFRDSHPTTFLRVQARFLSLASDFHTTSQADELITSRFKMMHVICLLVNY